MSSWTWFVFEVGVIFFEKSEPVFCHTLISFALPLHSGNVKWLYLQFFTTYYQKCKIKNKQLISICYIWKWRINNSATIEQKVVSNYWWITWRYELPNIISENPKKNLSQTNNLKYCKTFNSLKYLYIYLLRSYFLPIFLLLF